MTNVSNAYDIAIIGSGPGGYAAAVQAAQLGANVCIIEKENIGGTCLNWGCIPTKSLLHSAHSWQKVKTQNITSDDLSHISVDMKKIVFKSRKAVQDLTNDMKELLVHNKIKTYMGKAYIYSPREIKIGDHKIKTKHTIIATGAISRQHQLLQVDGEHILHAKHAMMLNKTPDSIAIIGGGVIGVEFASLFNALGSKVYLIELSDNILRYSDNDVIDYMQRNFTAKGIEIITKTSILDYKIINNVINLKLSSGKNLIVDKCLVAIGVTGNTSNLGLENTKVEVNNNMQIVTDTFSHTAEPSIYAIGDVNYRGPWLAHRASEEGRRCAKKILGYSVKQLDLNQITNCIYSMPQVASFGLNEMEALAAGKTFRIGKFCLKANGKAVATDDDGFIKLIIDKNLGTIIGANIVSANATELITSIGITKALGGICSELDYIFPHPTVSEVIPEAIMAAYNDISLS